MVILKYCWRRVLYYIVILPPSVELDQQKKQKILMHFSISPVCKMLIAEKDKQGPDLVIPVWVRPELEPDVDKGDKVDQICAFELVNKAVDIDIDRQCGF